MKRLFPQKGKYGRRAVFTAVSALVLLAAILLGIGTSAVKFSQNSYIDMTEEGFYTLSDTFLDVVGGIRDEITITFCADPDILLGNYNTRYTYIMAREIEKNMDNVHVVTCDVEKNPTAVQEYRATSASVIDWNDVIISCDKRYRLITAEAFFATDSMTEQYFAYNGEHKMATAMLSITALERPVAYMTVGHGEAVYDPEDPEAAGNDRTRAFYQLLTDVGLEVRTIDLDTVSAIPEDCVLLIMNGPTRDYAATRDAWLQVNSTPPLEMIDRYLDDFGSMMVFKDPDASLPTLEEYLTEWGIVYHNDVTVRENRTGAGDDAALEAERERLVAVYPDSQNHALGNSLFSDVADLSSAPRTIVAKSGYLTSCWVNDTKLVSLESSAGTSAVLLSSPDAKAYRIGTANTVADDKGSYALARITARVRAGEVGNYYSYVFCAATTALTDSEYLENPTYANYDILFSAIRTISRTDVYAGDELGGLNKNTTTYGGKRLVDTTIAATKTDVYKNGEIIYTYLGLSSGVRVLLTVLILLPSVAMLAIGLVVTVRRRQR